MILNYPSFGFPNYYRYNRGYYPSVNKYYSRPSKCPTSNSKEVSLPQGRSKNISEKNFSCKDDNKVDDDKVFEIFGIKLYFDDILLICLLFFLYNEGVQDQYLFISLVLLLLS